MHSPLDEVARLKSEVAGLKSELGVSERLRIAMYSSLTQKGGHHLCCSSSQHIKPSISHTWLMSGTGAKKGQEGQTAAVSMLLLGYGAATPLLSDTNVHYLLLFIVYHGWAVLLLHHSVIA